MINMRKIKSPCKNCPNRHLLCHSDCEEYLDFRDKVDEQHKIKDEIKNKRDLFFDPRMIKKRGLV